MYRDDPLADEEELRGVLGDDAVDELRSAPLADEAFERAVEVLRVLQGWVGDDEVQRWFAHPQQRLEGSTPLAALVAGAGDEVLAAAHRWAAAQG